MIELKRTTAANFHIAQYIREQSYAAGAQHYFVEALRLCP
jgi:hypothetical protein